MSTLSLASTPLRWHLREKFGVRAHIFHSFSVVNFCLECMTGLVRLVQQLPGCVVLWRYFKDDHGPIYVLKSCSRVVFLSLTSS